ncbi:uncharacterized protein N7511_008275 [Penicillium nucicola]|uniref:uncharacterized protein n=1 Tax=Penicillium nucicola TaxID=1850975 RepID=UPI002545BD8C|nr:uncharacterized protein N7511_008275 [Penicillium nucicola]KAJ5754122.1 hypothetical protein N7511_008275 [Penicillium nucicola]
MAADTQKRNPKKSFSWIAVLETLYDKAEKDCRIEWAPGVNDIFDGFDGLKQRKGKGKQCFTFDRVTVPGLSMMTYGLRYVPPDGELENRLVKDLGESNIYRTVKIEGLRHHTEVKDILPYVRGGVVLSASMYNTVALIGSYTAIIIFLEEQGAENFLGRVNRQGFFVPSETVYLSQIKTPTYPISNTLHDLIYKKGRRRTLVLCGSQQRLKAQIHRFLCQKNRIDRLEAFGRNDAADQVSFRFVSIAAAIDVHAMLLRIPFFESCNPTFGIDPCAQ